MGVVVTPLGFKKPDGKELVRDMDNIVSDNAELSDFFHTEARGRLAVLDPNAQTLTMTDQGMSAVINNTSSQFSGILQTRTDARIAALGRAVDPATKGVPVDGIADATVSFQAMLDALPVDGAVQFRPGQKFKITAPLNLTKPVIIRGRGAEFIANTTGSTLVIGASDVSLLGFKITGPGAAVAYTANQKFITTTGTDAARINRLHMAGVTLNECQSSSMWLDWLQDFVIERCNIDGFQYGGVMLLSPKRGWVTRNTVRNGIMSAPLVNAYGIAATDTINTAAARAEYVTINENYVDNIPGWEGIDTHGGLGIKVLDNTIRNCRTPIAVTGGNSTRVMAPEGFVISGNYVELGTAPTQTSGIFVDGVNATTLCYGTIGENTVRGFTTDLTLKDYIPERTSVAPQATDATTRRSPHHAPYRTWMATTTVSVPAGSSGAANAITFPAGMFSVPPLVQVTKQTSAGARFTTYAENITATGCDVGVFDASNGTLATTIPVAIAVTQSTPTGHSYPRP